MSLFLFVEYSLFFLPVSLSVIFLYKWLNTSKQKNQPPSPPKLPIIGNLHQLGKAPYRSLDSFSKKYGDLMLLHLGSKPTLVVSSANAALEIMKTNDIIFADRPESLASRKLFYNAKDLGFTPYGEHWRQMMCMCTQQLFSATRVRSFRAIREEETFLMVDKIRKSIPSKVNLSESLFTLTNDVTCRAAFGRKYSQDDVSNFMVLLKKFVVFLGKFAVGDFVPWLKWIDRIRGLEEKLDKIVKELDTVLEEILQDHIDSPNTQGNSKRDKVKDFVDVLLEVQQDGTTSFHIDRECIKALILDMLAPGTETTSTLLVWTMSELLRHPEALKELQEEVRRINQGKQTVKEHDLEKMEYLRAVIKETLRLHPPLPLLLFRESREDVRICGYDIEARTQVIINAFAIQRDPSFWEEPNEFHPERFRTSTVDFKGHDFQLIPFGSGRRGCPGIHFAMPNVELALANLVNAFDWELPDQAKPDTLDMTEKSGTSVGRRNPLIAVATPHIFR